MATPKLISDHAFYPNKGKCRAECFTCGKAETLHLKTGDVPIEGLRWPLGCRCTPCYQSHLRDLRNKRAEMTGQKQAGF